MADRDGRFGPDARMKPEEIERRSMEIISGELETMGFTAPEIYMPVIRRVIHTTADFDYAKTLYFSENVMDAAAGAFRPGTVIVTDTNMAKAGISARTAGKLGMELRCFMADPEVAEEAGRREMTRAAVSMERAAALGRPVVIVCGNAPTALFSLVRLHEETGFSPLLTVGVPVGFVNVVRSKELLIESGLPCIVNRGRKGGSGVAAAVMNALLYMLEPGRGR